MYLKEISENMNCIHFICCRSETPALEVYKVRQYLLGFTQMIGIESNRTLGYCSARTPLIIERDKQTHPYQVSLYFTSDEQSKKILYKSYILKKITITSKGAILKNINLAQ